MFLQGDDAHRVLDQIDTDGIIAGIQHLQRWDYGNETTDTALAQGHVYDTVPTGALDWTTEHGDYVLIANRHLGHVSLLRKTFLDTDPINKADGMDTEIAPARPHDPPARHAPSMPSARDDAFAHPFRPAHISAVVCDRGRGLGL